MPYKIEWFKKGVYIKAIGRYTIKDSIKSNGELYGDLRYESIEYQIGDFLDADVCFELEDVKVVAALESKASIWNSNMKIAHVTKDKVFIKLIKDYEKLVSDLGWEFGIFDNLKDAYKWVGDET